MPYHPQLSARLNKLFNDAIDHGINVIKKGDIPLAYLLTEAGEDKEIRVFANDSDDVVAQGVSDAKRQVSDGAARIEAYVIGFDGILTRSDGSKVDALILEGSERGLDFGFVFAQRYKKDADGKLVLIFGEPGPIKMSEQLLAPPQ